MSDFARKPGESPEAWIERLAHVRMEGLSDYLRAVLGHWKRDAAEMAVVDTPAPPTPASVPSAPPPAGEPTPLESAKRAVRALSPGEMLRLHLLVHARPTADAAGGELTLAPR